MFDKLSKTFFEIISAVTHTVLLLLLLSIPVFVIYQGEKDPEFTVYSSTVEAATGDSVLASKGISGEGWYKITYSCGARSGKYSPFTYSVGSFDLKAPKNIVKSNNYIISENGPFEFPGGDYTDFTLTLYVRADEAGAQAIEDSAGFCTCQVSQNFSMLKKDITFIVPGFDVADCRADAPTGG